MCARYQLATPTCVCVCERKRRVCVSECVCVSVCVFVSCQWYKLERQMTYPSGTTWSTSAGYHGYPEYSFSRVLSALCRQFREVRILHFKSLHIAEFSQKIRLNEFSFFFYIWNIYKKNTLCWWQLVTHFDQSRHGIFLDRESHRITYLLYPSEWHHFLWACHHLGGVLWQIRTQNRHTLLNSISFTESFALCLLFEMLH